MDKIAGPAGDRDNDKDIQREGENDTCCRCNSPTVHILIIQTARGNHPAALCAECMDTLLPPLPPTHKGYS